MYLWKYWRESRITFAVGMALVGLLLWGVLRIHMGAFGPGQPDDPSQLYLLIATPLTLPLGFFALRYGSFGVGSDLGRGSGSFLFSRPRSRAFFVWNDWGFGMAQLLLIVVAANLVLRLAIYRVAAGSGPILLEGQPVSMFSIFLLHCAVGLVLAGLIFGLTYFSSVLARGHGAMIAIGVLVAYSIAKSIVKHYWVDINLPDVFLIEFSRSRVGIGFADHLGLEIALRSAVALAFPAAAQLLLQQRDVD
jgi:hypothetical protein